jgi:hypothetical protein
MKKAFKYFLSLIIVIVTFNSCSKRNESPVSTNPTTVTEDKNFITERFNTTLNCATNIKDGLTTQALINFLAFSNGNISNNDWIKLLLNSLEDKMGGLKLNSEDSKFMFSDYIGTYTWNYSSQSFIKTSSNGIIIKFPSDPSKTTNNTTLQFLTYTDGLYQANAQNIYLPTKVIATLTKDNIQLASVDFTGIFSSGNFPRPVQIVLNVSINPHNYKITIGQITNTQFSAKIELGGDCNSVIDSKISFTNDDYNNFNLEEYLDKVMATYTKGNISIEANWDARTYYSLGTATTGELNSTFNSYVFNKTNKIGELKFSDIGKARKLFIYYKDGTSENTSFYYDPFTTQLKSIIRPYFGNQVDTWF